MTAIHEDVGYITMPPRDMLAITAPISVEYAAFIAGYTDATRMREDDVRQTVWAIMAMLRYEYADAILAARADEPTP